MLAIVLIVGMGEELWIRFVPEYVVALGGAVWAVAAYRTLFNLLDAIYQYPGGWVADHLGRRRALIVFTLVAAAGYGVYLVNEMRLSYVEFGLLMTVQRLTNIVVYVPLAALSDRMNRKPFVLATFAFFALFPLVLVNVTG